MKNKNATKRQLSIFEYVLYYLFVLRFVFLVSTYIQTPFLPPVLFSWTMWSKGVRLMDSCNNIFYLYYVVIGSFSTHIHLFAIEQMGSIGNHLRCHLSYSKISKKLDYIAIAYWSISKAIAQIKMGSIKLLPRFSRRYFYKTAKNGMQAKSCGKQIP